MPAVLGQRDLFPALEAAAYLNHAAVSPLSTPVREAALLAIDDNARRGVGAFPDAVDQRNRLRASLAAWLGAEPADIGFPPGTTRGILDIALAIPWKRGDRIVVFDGEFPSNVLPWMQVAERFGLELVLAPLGKDAGVSALREALPARLVAVSTVQFSSGLRMPVEEMAAMTHAAGGELFVDAIQALGVVPVHVGQGFDYLVAGTHKWLMGMDGLAVAYASPAARDVLRPLTAGWLSKEHALGFLFEPDLLRYDHPVKRSLDWMEAGVQTTAPFYALEKSVELIRSIGVDAIFAHVQRWHDAAEPGLVERGFTSVRAIDPEMRSGSLCLHPPAGVALPALSAGLAAHGVSVSTPDGHLRLAPHWPNSLSEVDTLFAAVDAVLG